MKNFLINPRFKWRWEKGKNGEPLLLSNNLFVLNTTAFEVLDAYKNNGFEGTLNHFQKKYPGTPVATLQKDIERVVTMLKEWNILIEQKEEKKMPLAPSFMEIVESVFENTLSAPLHAACLLTYSCNAQCPHCYALYSNKHRELSTDHWKTLIDQLVEMQVFSITFTGGEPLMRKDVDQLVQHAHRNGVTVGIDTNGYFLTKEKIENLIAKGVSGFEISLDGSCPTIHDTYRGLPGSFSQVIAALSNLVDESVDVGVATAVSNQNLDDVGTIIDVVYEIGVRRHSLIRLRHVAPTVKELEPTPEEYIRLLQVIFKKQQELNQPFIYPDLPALYYQKSIGLDHYQELREYNCIRSCEAGIVTCGISPSGDLLPCDMSLTPVGNGLKTPLKKLWKTSAVLQQLRNIHMNQVDPCNHCDLSRICTAGCKALSSQLLKENILPDPVCVSCSSWNAVDTHG